MWMMSLLAQPPSRIRPQLSRSTAIGWAAVGLLLTGPAMAEPSLPIDLHWEAPTGCPQENDARARILKLLGSRRPDNDLRAEGTIVRTHGRFRLELVVRVAGLVETRTLESNSCEDLAGAAAVELGLLIHSADTAGEPNRTRTQPPTSPPVSGPKPPNSRSEGTDEHPPQGTSNASPAEQASKSAKAASKTQVESEAKAQPPSVESQRRWRALVQAPLLALGVGPLPRPTLGVGLSLGLEYAKWQLQLNAIYWKRQRVPALDFPGYGADVDRIGAAFWAGREFRFSWFALSPCLTVGLERVSARGTGRNITPSTRDSIGMTAGAGAQGRLYLASWIRLLMAVGGQVELSRPQISINGVGSVDQFAPAALLVAGGLEWIL
jgi:hypothetical protein